MAYKRLGDILVSAGMITEEQLARALDEGRKTGKRLGEVLIDSGILAETQIIDVLKLQLGVDYVDLTTTAIPTSMAQLVSKNLARKHTVVPVKTAGDTLYLAMQDPMNFMAIEEVRAATRKRVIPMIATRSAVTRAIVTLYGNEGVSQAIDELQRSIGVAPGETLPASEEEDEQAAPVIRLVNSIIERAAAENASDIHLEPREKELTVRMRIDGVLHTMLTIPTNLQSAILSRVKVMGNMDIAERRVPQDGRTHVRAHGREIDLRISTLPTVYGEKAVIRFLERSADLLSSRGIGLSREHLSVYQDLMANTNGVILIAGPTGSGKSTTMYTMISELNTDAVNLVTLEDPVEYNLDGVNQVQINEKVGMTFADGLRSILRQDPDIIAVGEIRDGETAEIAMRSAITGHLVLSTIHTNSALATLDRLVDIGVEPYLVATALKGVLAQRLVRRVCPHCRTAYTPAEEELEMLGISPEEAKGVRFYRGTGCPECLHSGYRGRIAVFEILKMTPEIRRQYRDRVPMSELTDTVLASGFRPMRDDCRRLVLEGVTTAEEVRRILHSADL